MSGDIYFFSDSVVILVFNSKQAQNQEVGRFRKRDKALFYGRKMMRKVKNISGQVRNSGQGKKRKMVMKFARRLLQIKKDEQEQLKVRFDYILVCLLRNYLSYSKLFL